MVRSRNPVKGLPIRSLFLSAAGTPVVFRFSIYSSDISASQVCPPLVHSASVASLHICFNLSTDSSRPTLQFPENPLCSPHSTSTGQDTDLHLQHHPHPFSQDTLNTGNSSSNSSNTNQQSSNFNDTSLLPFSCFSQTLIPPKYKAPPSGASNLHNSIQQTKNSRCYPHSVQPTTNSRLIIGTWDLIPLIIAGIRVLFINRLPFASGLSLLHHETKTVPLVNLLPGAFNLLYIKKVVSSAESMHVLLDVTSYFATAGSQSLKNSMRGLLDSENSTLGTALPKKVWAVLQSQTRIPSPREIAKALSSKVPSEGPKDLENEAWDDLNGDLEELASGRQGHSHLDLASLSDIEVDDTECDSLPTSTQGIPIPSLDYHGSLYAPSEIDGDEARGSSSRRKRDADLNFDVNFDDEEMLNDPETYVNCARPQSFEETFIPDIWEYDGGFGMDHQPEVDAFSDAGLDSVILQEMDSAVPTEENETHAYFYSHAMDRYLESIDVDDDMF